MLKKFFISMLGSMAAFWLSMFILFFGSIIAITSIIAKNADTKISANGQVLHIKLAGPIQDRAGTGSVYDIMSYADEQSDDLATIIAAVNAAKDDKQIKGILIDCAGSELGIASRCELMQAVADFRQSGKWVYAYADNYTQGDYYVASAADAIYLNPVGSVDIRGLQASVMFFKNLLESLGIDIDVIRVGSYKSAVEPFLRMDMSVESREQTEEYINLIWEDVLGSISSNRNIAERMLDEWVDNMMFTWDPQRYVDNKIVTKLTYRSELDDMIRDEIGINRDEDVPLITPSQYLIGADNPFAKESEDHIAVLYAIGDIVDTGEGGIASDVYVPEILRLAKDKHVKAMVLRVNSGGGSAFASEQIWKALEDFKAEGKPLYVSMSDYAASGGYYISCGAEKIYADAATLTGSIGIFGLLPNASRLVRQKLHLNIQTVETNNNTSFPSLYHAPTDEQLYAMQEYIDRGYETFTKRVAQGRGLPQDSVKAIGGGRVWDGQTALRIGLVDEIGSLDSAIAGLNLKLGKDYRTVAYPAVETGWLEMLVKSTKGNITVNIPGIGTFDSRQYYSFTSMFSNYSPLQARMQPITMK